LAEKAPFLALAAAGARLALWAQAHAGAALRPIGEHGWLERALQAAYGLCWYPWKTLAPAGLSPIYELPAELSLGEPRFALAAAGALALTALLVAARRRAPAALAAWVAFAVIASPVLGWAQSGPQLVADRYGYLACLPFALLAGWAAGRLFLARPALALGLAAGAALALGAAARDRSRDWRDSTALWEAAYQVAPESGVTLLSLGSAREEAAREEPSPERRRALLDEARSLFERGAALAAGPRFTANLGRVHEQLAELEPERAAEHRARAVELFERALAEAEAAGEDTADFELNLGAALVNAGRPGEALERLARCVARRPDEPRARLSYGMALALSGRVPESLEHFERAAALLPASTEAWGKLGDARRSAGDRAGAIAAYRRVLALEPGHAAAQRRLAELGAAAGE
jgi:tetratricopeptide (TPR) repeat protein